MGRQFRVLQNEPNLIAMWRSIFTQLS